MMGTKTSGTTTENIPIYKDKYAYSPVLGWLECTKLGASTLISENGYAYKSVIQVDWEQKFQSLQEMVGEKLLIKLSKIC